MRLLSYWPRTKTGDADWDTVTDLGYVDERFAPILTHQTQRSRVSNEGLTMYYEATGDQLPKYRCTVMGGAIPIAGIMLLEKERCFSDEDAELLTAVARAVANMLQKTTFAEGGGSDVFDTVLRRIVEGEGGDTREVRDLLAAQGVADGMGFVAFHLGFNADQHRYVPYWSRLFNGNRNALFGTYGNALLGVAAISASYDQTVEAFAAIARRSLLKMGASGEFADLGDVRGQLMVAREVYEVGSAVQPDRDLWCYADLTYEMLLYDPSFQRHLRSHPDPRVEALKRHDAEHGTSYCDVVHGYLMHNGNLSEAARASFRHRNTFSYQLERASELAGIDFSDHSQRMSMLLAFDDDLRRVRSERRSG